MLGFNAIRLTHCNEYISFSKIANMHSICVGMCNIYWENIMDIYENSLPVSKEKIKCSNNYFDKRCSLVKELLLCQEGTLDCGVTLEEISDLLKDVCTN